MSLDDVSLTAENVLERRDAFGRLNDLLSDLYSLSGISSHFATRAINNLAVGVFHQSRSIAGPCLG